MNDVLEKSLYAYTGRLDLKLQEIVKFEDFINGLSPAVLRNLLQDHTRSTAKAYVPIFWATDNYKNLGPDYAYNMPIRPELITGKHNKVVQPRVVKSKAVQVARSKNMAEVFTPSWVCNCQNNLIDENWFGRKEVFNKEIENEDGSHTWEMTPGAIQFPVILRETQKTWQDYVKDVRLEITCGEGPYVVSRYDTTTGEFIPVERRIGLLDRKLRVVGENTTTKEEWLEWAEWAFKSVYGFEWQGDSLLLAREAVLMTLMDYCVAKFDSVAPLAPETLEHFAEIISWNFWQMDGLKGVVPNSCCTKEVHKPDLLLGDVVTKVVCEGCAKNNIHRHNGTYCKIKDWQDVDSRTKKLGRTIKFIDTMK